LKLFEPFLEAHYKGKWRKQARSFGIEMSKVDLDVVITSAPSEAVEKMIRSRAITTMTTLEEDLSWRFNSSWYSKIDQQEQVSANGDILLKEAAAATEWKSDPLRIPDRMKAVWEDTHPIEQIVWTRNKNANTSGNFVNVVKAIKWWRLEHLGDLPNHPKGFPLERIVGDCCPDDIESVAQGIVATMNNFLTKYKTNAENGITPTLPDYGVPSHNVLGRIISDDFVKFYVKMNDAYILAAKAYESEDKTESGNLWRELLGGKFPKPPDNGGESTKVFIPPAGPAGVKKETFA
jgi:hypothetical protein